MRTGVILAMLAAISVAPAAILYDNGPLSTGTTHNSGAIAPPGTTFSEIQTNGTLTNGTLGYSVNYLNTTSIGSLHQADDFTVGPGGWSVSSFVVYGFRSNGSISEQYNTGVLRIWDGVPGQPDSSIVAGDLSTNILQNTAFTNIYRTGRASGSLIRPIMAATLTFPTPVILPAGTYWLDYGLTSAGNTFAPLVTRPGEVQPPNANAMLFTSNQWFTMTDTNSGTRMELPFQVVGREASVVSGTLVLGDSVSEFAVPRTIVYTVMQGSTPVGGGVLPINVSSADINLSAFPTGSGPVEIEFDGSSWLKRRLTVTLTGSTTNIGTIVMNNGDADASGEVDAADIDTVIADFGSTYPGGSTPDADVDVSGEVDAADIDIVIANFGAVDQ